MYKIFWTEIYIYQTDYNHFPMETWPTYTKIYGIWTLKSHLCNTCVFCAYFEYHILQFMNNFLNDQLRTSNLKFSGEIASWIHKFQLQFCTSFGSSWIKSPVDCCMHIVKIALFYEMLVILFVEKWRKSPKDFLENLCKINHQT